MKIIVNANKDWAIGKDGGLLINIPADMRYFREQTRGAVIIMGRRTLLGLPGSKPLKGRINLVLSRDPSNIAKESLQALDRYYDLSKAHPDMSDAISKTAIADIIQTAENNFKLSSSEVAPHDMKTFLVVSDQREKILKLSAAIEKEIRNNLRDHKNPNTDKIFVIGGESIYREFLNDADECLVTMNDCTLQGDSFFPDLSLEPGWMLKQKGTIHEYRNIHFSFDTWEKVKIKY